MTSDVPVLVSGQKDVAFMLASLPERVWPPTATPGKATAQLRFDYGDGAVAELECQTLATNAGNLVFVREITGNPEF